MIDQTYPKIDLNTPKIELGTPKIDLNIPKIELGNPKINLESSLLLTQMVASSVQGLLSLGIIADATDLKRVTAAMEFLRNPTGNFAVLSKHIGDIA
jgi:hypothetical protein